MSSVVTVSVVTSSSAITSAYLPVNNTAANVTVHHVVNGRNTQSLQFFKLMSFSTRSSQNKLCDLDVLLSTDQPDIVCITETWLNDTVSDAMINGKGNYTVFRTDRTCDGGGVCILCKINPSYKLTGEKIFPADKYQIFETVVVDVSVCDDEIRLITVYRPPK